MSFKDQITGIYFTNLLVIIRKGIKVVPWEKGEDQEGFLGDDSDEEGERGAEG